MLKKVVIFLALMGMTRMALGQIPLDNLGGSMCGMIDPETRSQVAVSPAFTQVNIVVNDAVAQAVVTQTFVNPFREASEAVYLFPLPDQGSVHGMRYVYRDSLYVAEIMDRVKAEAKYDSIRKEGGQAALLLQDRPNIFQQRLANIAPGETAKVEIRLSMALKYVDGDLELAFPARVGPRYPAGPGSPGGWNPPENREGPGLQFNVLVRSGVELSSITSPSHAIEVGEVETLRKTLVERRLLAAETRIEEAHSRAVVLSTRATYPNRDFVLRLKRAKDGQDFSLASHSEADGKGHFLLNLYPDKGLFTGARPDLEVVLLVDVSGSQMGWPLARQKEIVLDILGRLGPKDRFNVLSFSNSVRYAFGGEAPVSASSENLAAAGAFVRGLVADGGTELLNAVKATLAVPGEGTRPRYYIFLTDGFITDEAAILSAIRGHASRPTIFTFGAGNNLNRYFLEECAKVGDGFATPMVEGDAVKPLVDAAWSRIESPQLSDIRVDFGGMEVSEVLHPVSRKLYRGLPYLVTGKFAKGGTFTVTLSASRDGTPVKLSRQVALTGDGSLSWAVPKLWAREKIGRLMMEQGTTHANKAAIIEVSSAYQVLSAYTAFLASNPQALNGSDPGLGRVTTGLEEAVFRPAAATFTANVRGGMLHLDWKAPAQVAVIHIHDLHGRLLFSFRPTGGRLLSKWVWDGRDVMGRMLARGRYLVSVQGADGIRTLVIHWNPARP